VGEKWAGDVFGCIAKPSDNDCRAVLCRHSRRQPVCGL